MLGKRQFEFGLRRHKAFFPIISIIGIINQENSKYDSLGFGRIRFTCCKNAYVSVVNAMLVQDYGNNSLRRSKTDKKDIESAWATRGYASGSDSALSQNTTYRW